MTDSSENYSTQARRSGVNSVKWNGIGLVGRQLLMIGFSLILARMLGPESYGIIAQATVFMTFATLVLDQGISAALISKSDVSRRLLGASITANLLLALVIIGITLLLAPVAAKVLQTPELETVLPVLAIGLAFKGAQIVPRMLLTRRFAFDQLARAEIGAAAAGGVAGVVAAFAGWGYWALVAQLVITDLLLALMMLVAARPPGPNLRLGELKHIFGFSLRVFAGALLNFGSRNADTLLIARYLGEVQVGFYSLAYRVLLMPIQMVGQTITRVIFPVVARDRDTPADVAALLVRSARTIALLAFPLIALMACAARDGIAVVLGEAWLPAAPLIAVLAVTGARQSVTALNAPVMLGFGRADIQLRFVIAAAVVQIAGIVCGLPFGTIGVAIGYTLAGVLLTPLILLIQRHLAGTSIRAQLGAMGPAAHACLWGSLGYGLPYLLGFDPWGHLVAGGILFVLLYVGALAAFHRSTFSAFITDLRALITSRQARRS